MGITRKNIDGSIRYYSDGVEIATVLDSAGYRYLKLTPEHINLNERCLDKLTKKAKHRDGIAYVEF